MFLLFFTVVVLEKGLIKYTSFGSTILVNGRNKTYIRYGRTYQSTDKFFFISCLISKLLGLTTDFQLQ